MKNIFKSYMLAVTLLLCTSVQGHAIPSRPSTQRLVNDFAGIFTPEQRQRLEYALVAFDDSTSNQIAVVTVKDLEGYGAMEYATRIGLDWGVGSGNFNNGVVLLIKPKTAFSNGDVAISVGYGLEGAIPDAYAKRIIGEEIIPRFREEDYFGGTVAACTVMMKLASGEISAPREKKDSGGMAGLITFIILFILLPIFFAGINRRGGGNNRGGGRYRDDGDIASAIIIGSLLGGGRGHSSGGFGGGSFGGGSFGGFGGGSFGGGGASGSW